MLETLTQILQGRSAEWVLWLLGALSVISLTIIFERALFLFRRRVDIRVLGYRIDALLADGNRDEALRVLGATPGMEAIVGKKILDNIAWPHGALEDLYRSSLESEKLSYEAYLAFLATLGANTPFIGLFGTVLGIIGAFADLSGLQQGQSRAQAIMGSISEALVATAVGLLVAIPAVMAFNYFQRRVDRSVSSTEVLVRAILARYKSRVG